MPSMTPLVATAPVSAKPTVATGPKFELGTRDQIMQIMRTTKCFVFDCDGVIWKGQTAINDAQATIKFLYQMGKQVFFVTNHPSDSRVDLKAKFDRLGFEVQPEQIYSSAYSATEYLKYQNFDQENKKVLIIGAQGLVDEFNSAGFKTVGGPEHDRMMVGDEEIEVDEDVDAIVGGTDPYFNYYKCAYAHQCMLKNPNCKFVSTNEDPAGHIFAPTQVWPGAGAIIGALKACTGKTPTLVGKPSDFLVTMIRDKVQEAGFAPKETMMLGDRLDTDIEFGTNAGFKTSLVLTGCAKVSDINGKVVPNYVLDSIADFIKPKKVVRVN